MLRWKSAAGMSDSSTVDIQYALEASTSIMLVRYVGPGPLKRLKMLFINWECNLRNIKPMELERKGKTPYDFSV